MSPLIVCFASLALLCRVALASVEPSEDWLSLYGKVFDFNKEGAIAKGSETLDMLKELQTTGAELADNRRMDLAGELLAVSEYKPEKCNINQLEHIGRLIEKNSPFKRTILPYLREQRIDMAVYCQVQSAESLKSIVESFGKWKVSRMDAIKRSVFEEKASTLLSNAKAAEDFLKYFEEIQGDEMKSKICDSNGEVSKKKTRQFLSDQVTRPCEDIVAGLKDPLANYELFAGQKNIYDETVELWAINRLLCERIVPEIDALAEEFYKSYIKNHPEAKLSMKSKLSKLIS